MRVQQLIQAALVILALAFALNAAAQSYSIDWHTIDGGGGTSTGGAYSVSGTRRSVTTGRTWYVLGGFNTCIFQTGYSDCAYFSGGPLGGFLTATELVNPAGGDVIRIRFGINETDNLPRTYTKPATWRNAEGYNITIGRP